MKQVFCPHCATFVDSHVEDRKENLPVKGETVEIIAATRICDVCGSILFDPELDDRSLQIAYNAYRQNHNLLFPGQIRAIREKYRLSQTAFARVLGLGEKTIARYENGSLQDEAQDNLIMLMDKPENFFRLLKQNKAKLKSQEFDLAMSTCSFDFIDDYPIDHTNLRRDAEHSNQNISR